MNMRILRCNSEIDATTKENIILASEDLMDGKLVVYPTETVYGIAADIFNQKAVKELYGIGQTESPYESMGRCGVLDSFIP